MLIKSLHNYSLYLFVFLIHFEYWDLLPGSTGIFSLTKLAGYIYFIFAIIYHRQSFRTTQLLSSLVPLWIFYLLLFIQSAYNFIVYPLISSLINFSIFQCIILFWIVVNHLREDKNIIPIVLRFYVLGAIVISLLSIFNIGITLTWDQRILIFGEDPNYVGYRLTFAMLIVVNFFFDKELRINKYGYLWAFALPLLLKTLAFTASRGAILCLFSGLLIIGMLLKTKWFIKPIILLVFIASIFLAFSILDKNPVFHERYLKTVEGHDTAHRMEIWERLSDLFYVNPLMGIGETGYNQSTIEIFGRVRGSHNVYIEILLKTGIIGLLTFFLFIYSELKKGINSWSNESKPFPLVMLFAILFLFTNIQGLYNKSIYLFFALIFVISKTSKKKLDVN